MTRPPNKDETINKRPRETPIPCPYSGHRAIIASASNDRPKRSKTASPQARDSYLNSQQDRQVYLSVDEPFSGSILGDILGDDRGASPEEWLIGIAQAALDEALEGTEAAQMSLLITDDETVQSLNAQFRGVDEVTDVLSFSAEHPGHWEGEAEPPSGPAAQGSLDFVMPPGEPSAYGEGSGSSPQARRRAGGGGAATPQGTTTGPRAAAKGAHAHQQAPLQKAEPINRQRSNGELLA